MTLPNEISVTAVLLSFTGGLITGFNPCCYTAIPGTVGYLGGSVNLPQEIARGYLHGWD